MRLEITLPVVRLGICGAVGQPRPLPCNHQVAERKLGGPPFQFSGSAVGQLANVGRQGKFPPSAVVALPR